MPTPPKRRKRGAIDAIVHATLVEANCPVSAYGLVRRLSRSTASVSAPLVFRSLARLIMAGRVGRIECRSSYVAVRSGPGIELLCTQCHDWQRVADNGVHGLLAELTRTRGFTPLRVITEVTGFCSKCVPVRSGIKKQRLSTRSGHVVSSRSSP